MRQFGEPEELDIAEDLDLDLGDTDARYRDKQVAKQADSKTLDGVLDLKDKVSDVESKVSGVESNVSSLADKVDDVVSKQASALENTTQTMTTMQSSLDSVLNSQVKLMDTMTDAIQRKYRAGIPESSVQPSVQSEVLPLISQPLLTQNERLKSKQRKERIWGITKALALVSLIGLVMVNDTARNKVVTIAVDIKDIVVGLATNQDVSSNKLLEDLGIELSDEIEVHNKNKIYFDESGNKITEEEYYRKLYGEDNNNLESYKED